MTDFDIGGGVMISSTSREEEIEALQALLDASAEGQKTLHAQIDRAREETDMQTAATVAALARIKELEAALTAIRDDKPLTMGGTAWWTPQAIAGEVLKVDE